MALRPSMLTSALHCEGGYSPKTGLHCTGLRQLRAPDCTGCARGPYNWGMSSLRRHRFLTVLIALCSLLFMQLAVAGYPCPGFGSRVQEISAMAEAGMPCAESMSMDMEEGQPALCHAHCESAQPVGDTYAVQVPVIDVDNGAFRAAAIFIALPRGVNAQSSLLTRATAPPLGIRNCCLRI